MFIKQPKIQRSLKKRCIRLIDSIENNNNCDFSTNGEQGIFKIIYVVFLKQTKEVKNMFDVGANKGNYSQIIKDLCLKNNINYNLHLFEPTQSCYQELGKKFKDENIVINKYGISDKKVAAKIFYDEKSSGLASLYKRQLKFYNLELNKSEDIKLIRMDEYIKQKEIQHIHFLKMDIEGNELKALSGLGKHLNNSFIDFVQF